MTNPINVLSKVALSKGEDNNELHPYLYLSRIRDYAAQTMESMSDIVWTINPRNDKLEAVISRMKEFAADLCEAQGIELRFNLPSNLETLAFNLVKRKNLFLVFKEAVSNAVKHSQCSLLDIHFEQKRNQFQMITHDSFRDAYSQFWGIELGVFAGICDLNGNAMKFVFPFFIGWNYD